MKHENAICLNNAFEASPNRHESKADSPYGGVDTDEITPDEEDDGRDWLSVVKRLATIVMLFVLGYSMISNPHLYDDGVRSTGRHFLFKMVLKSVWGTPLGLLLVIAGGWLLIRLVRKLWFA